MIGGNTRGRFSALFGLPETTKTQSQISLLDSPFCEEMILPCAAWLTSLMISDVEVVKVSVSVIAVAYLMEMDCDVMNCNRIFI